MKSNKTTLILQKGDTKYKLMKIIFGPDGSYYVTAPYHNQKKAFLFKAQVDYGKYEQLIPIGETIERAVLDDDELRLKISHRPDGFLKFSGNGIISGKNADGTIKGIGIQSWPLSSPPRGPAFAVTIKNYHDMAKSTCLNAEELYVNVETISGDDDDTLTFVEGFFIPKPFEQCIYKENNSEYISIANPSGVILKLHVIRPAKINKYFGFIGIHIYLEALNPDLKYSEYTFSTSSGSVLSDDNKLLKGICLYAVYPRITDEILPSLNWSPQ